MEDTAPFLAPPSAVDNTWGLASAPLYLPSTRFPLPLALPLRLAQALPRRLASFPPQRPRPNARCLAAFLMAPQQADFRSRLTRWGVLQALPWAPPALVAPALASLDSLVGPSRLPLLPRSRPPWDMAALQACLLSCNSSRCSSSVRVSCTRHLVAPSQGLISNNPNSSSRSSSARCSTAEAPARPSFSRSSRSSTRPLRMHRRRRRTPCSSTPPPPPPAVPQQLCRQTGGAPLLHTSPPPPLVAVSLPPRGLACLRSPRRLPGATATAAFLSALLPVDPAVGAHTDSAARGGLPACSSWEEAEGAEEEAVQGKALRTWEGMQGSGCQRGWRARNTRGRPRHPPPTLLTAGLGCSCQGEVGRLLCCSVRSSNTRGRVDPHSYALFRRPPTASGIASGSAKPAVTDTSDFRRSPN